MRTRSNRLRMFTDAIAANIMPAYESEQLLHQAPASISRPVPRRRQSVSNAQSNPFESTPTPPNYRRHAPQFDVQASSPSSCSASTDVMMRNIVMGTALLVAMLMFMHAAVYVAIFVVGVLTPAWRTFKCMEGRADSDVVVQLVETDEYDNDVIDVDEMNIEHENGQQTMHNWHSYWVLSALLFTLHSFVMSPILGRIIPSTLYNTMLFALLSWMTRNKAANSALIYGAFVRPALLKVETSVDIAASKAMFHMDRASQQLILGVHEAITPVVRQLEQAAASTAAQMQQHGALQAHGRHGLSRNQR